MKQELYYFLFNKERDYRRGWLEGMDCSREGLWVRPESGRGLFLSRVLDSREKGMRWHRLAFSFDRPGSAPFVISVFASDSLSLGGGSGRDIREVIADPAMEGSEKLRLLAPFRKRRETGLHDLLLEGVCGRYLWLAIELFNEGEEPRRLQGLQVWFPWQSWLDLLPEVYQASDTDGFLARYLAIFQTLYEEMDEKIRRIPQLFDVDEAPREYLQWLASWLDIAGSYMWTQEQLRSLLKSCVALYRRRGTREGILRLIGLYTGGPAWLVERHELLPYLGEARRREQLDRLYGTDSSVVTVIVTREQAPSQKEYRALLRVIEEMKPAQVEVNLVVLEPYMYLGGHTYMGINSAFGAYRSPALDGHAALPFTRL